MNREFYFSEVLSRAKECFGCKKDKDLADILGISPQVLGNRKKTESIPYAEIVSAAMVIGADVQYILTGVPSASAPSAAALSRDEAALLDNYRNIQDTEDKTAVSKLALRCAEAAKQGKEESRTKKKA